MASKKESAKPTGGTSPKSDATAKPEKKSKAAAPSQSSTSALSATPPTLTVDEAELKKWGYIWRVGTKPRSKKAADDDEPEDEVEADDEEEEGTTDYEAGQGAPEPKSQPIPVVVQPLTADAAGVPADVRLLFDEAKKYPSAFNKKQGMDFGFIFDLAVGKAFATMLGGIEVVEFKGSKKGEALTARKTNCVEVGPARIIGGIRPQNFDVAYRPDGVRIAFDSKTLNDISSIQKNWQNMINDLGTEATTVHTRFPYAIVALLVIIPKPALKPNQQADMIRVLERLATRKSVIDQAHLAEAIALAVWDPETGKLDHSVPGATSPLRLDNFMPTIHARYVERYKGLPPHDKFYY